MKSRNVIIIFFIMASFLLISCKDKSVTDTKNKLDSIEQKQTEILARLNAIEANQKELTQLFRPKRPEFDYNKVHNIPLGDSPVKGKKEAPVTIAEFSDFQCPYCSKLQPVLKQVLEAYPNDVKLVFKNFPLSFHQQAMNAARASHAAGEQGKYWEMHDIIFENYNKLDEGKFKEFAGKLNLDVDKFMKDSASGRYDKPIEADIKLGRDIGVSGTPTLYVNGRRMGNRTFDDFKAAIEGSLKKVR